MLKVGTLCYPVTQGLGILAKAFYDQGIVTDALVVQHAHRKNHNEWYPISSTIPVKPFDSKTARAFCKTMNVMLFFETPFDWELIEYCRSIKVKTILMTMYECTPEVLPNQPLHYFCPSLLDRDYYPKRSSLVTVPVDTRIEWKLRKKAKVYVHNAGHGGLKGRNGTSELLEAMKFVRHPIKLIIRSQDPLQWTSEDSRVEIRTGTVPFHQLYDEGDVFIFPEKFNGLSLPLQEAYASGMLVMGTDRYPMNTWLPNAPLITPSRYLKSRVSNRCNEFKEAILDPKDIALMIDEWYSVDIREYSYKGKDWGADNSWERLKPEYIKLIRTVAGI